MNPFKAAGYGIVLYILLWIVALTVMYTMGIPYTDRVLVFATPLFSIPLSYFYLRDVAEKQFMESIELGFFWAVLTISLDIATFVSLLGLGWSFFDSPLVWVKYGSLVFFNGIIGTLIEGSQEQTPFKEYKNNSNW